MGNSAKIIGKHYRRVMSLAESEALFSILPPEDAEAKILRVGSAFNPFEAEVGGERAAKVSVPRRSSHVAGCAIQVCNNRAYS